MTAKHKGLERKSLRWSAHNKKIPHKILACLLILAIILPVGSTPFVYASDPLSETGGLCPHHPAHTADCGYIEATLGSPCTHTHNADCLFVPQDGDECNHTHDATCGYTEGVDEIPCDQDCIDTDGDGLIDHASECAFQPAQEGTPATTCIAA